MAKKKKTGNEKKGRTRSFLSISAANFVDRADMQALPTYYTSIGRELAVGRGSLGLITTSRSALQTIAAPLWGYLADRYSRRVVLAIGCLIWGVFTIFCAFAGDFSSLLFFRLLAGFGLATIIPTGFSLIIDYFKPEDRGKWLGFFQMIGVLGIAIMVPILGMIDAPNYTFGLESDLFTLFIYQQIYPGTIDLVQFLYTVDTFMKYTVHYGAWRVGFIILGVISLVVAAVVWFLVKEPVRGGTEKELKDVITVEAAEKYKIERKAVGEILRTRTMQIIILQGMLGYMPWIVFQAWLVHWLESVRYITPSDATIVFAVLVVGVALGNGLGGWLGDKGERRSFNRGRIIVAQISVFSGIPLSFLVLTLPLSVLHYIILTFITAVLVSWAGPGAVQPMVANVTKPEVRSTSFSIEQMFEGGFAAIAAVLTGFLADTMNGGVAGVTMQSITPYMGFWLGVIPLPTLLVLFTLSGQSLTTAMLMTIIIPWVACLLVWFLAYRTYPKDRDRIFKLLEERRKEMARKS
ncbi:MAG: MFS transporter [Candidatus Jordarchaeum sp.]|uniref:MFS transporter n=1 Tax=Candidatus Jordarchaeum sp. TaxID=2823881 RepID=UPI00404A6E88